MSATFAATVEILGVPQSIYVRSVRMACIEKGIEARLIAVPPHSPEVLAINPFGTIPVLRHGAARLFESKAIACYLDARFDGPPLVPSQLPAAAEVEQWVAALNTRVVPAFVRYTRCHFQSGRRRATPDGAGIAAILPEVSAYAEILERVARAEGLAAGVFSLADLALLPILAYLEDLPETRPMLTGTRLATYLATHRRRPSFTLTEPSRAQA